MSPSPTYGERGGPSSELAVCPKGIAIAPTNGHQGFDIRGGENPWQLMSLPPSTSG